MSNKKKFEKSIIKKLEKMYAAEKKNPNVESRLLFVSGKYGFSVIRMEEIPGSGRSFVDSAEFVMNKTVAKALSTSNMYISQNIGSIKARMYDGQTLANSFDAKRDVIGSSVDYAKMQGIDLDEVSDRQRDNYVDHPDGRKDTFMRVDGTNIPLKVNNIFEKVVADKKKLEQEVKEAHDKAAEDYETIQKLIKEVGDLKIQLGKQNEMISQLKHPTPIEASSIVPVSEKPNALSTIVMDMNTKIDKLAEKVDGAETKEEEPEEESEEELSSVFGVTIGKKPFESPVHKDELPDDYMLTLLQNTKKPYNLRTIFKLQSNIYEEIDPAVYLNLIGIRDPRTANVRNFSRTAYAVAIALSVPESYVGSFMRRLIDDYKYADFKPTDPKYLPEDFPNFVESLYPDIARIHRLLHITDVRELPYVCKKEVGTSTEYYMIGARPYDNPSYIRDTDYYIAIPKNANPYDFLEYDKTKELVMIFSRSTHNNKHRPIQLIMHDVDSSVFRDEYDKISTMRDQINRYIAADEAGLISIGCNNSDEILMNGLWFYPVVWGYTVDKF